METVLTSEPATITAGDSVSWTKCFSDYPAASWTLTYALVMAGELIEITASQDGTSDGYIVEIDAATTADYTPGTYKYQAYVSGGSSERYTVGTGEIEVLPDFASQDSGYDDRSFAKKCLDAIESLIVSGKTSTDTYSYAIHGRQMVHYSWEELLGARDRFKFEYQCEQDAATGRTSRKIKARFSGIS